MKLSFSTLTRGWRRNRKRQNNIPQSESTTENMSRDGERVRRCCHKPLLCKTTKLWLKPNVSNRMEILTLWLWFVWCMPPRKTENGLSFLIKSRASVNNHKKKMTNYSSAMFISLFTPATPEKPRRSDFYRVIRILCGAFKSFRFEKLFACRRPPQLSDFCLFLLMSRHSGDCSPRHLIHHQMPSSVTWRNASWGFRVVLSDESRGGTLSLKN